MKEGQMLDPRMPRREDCVIHELIERHGRDVPDQPFALFADGPSWTYGQMRDQVRACAQALQTLGVKQGDFVLCWMANSAESLRVMLALNHLGAVYVPINTGYRGGLLEHVIANSGARLMVADVALVERLRDVPRAALCDLVVVGGAAPAIDGLCTHGETALDGDAAQLMPPERPIQPWDTLSVIYTSGTTGPSKGVLSSCLHVWSTFVPNGSMRPQDRTLVTLPMFHMGGAGPIWVSLMRRGSFALAEAFSTRDFWPMVRRFEVTHTILLGAMTPFLLKVPASADDRTHPLQRVTMVPLSDQHRSFSERFGVDVFTSFNMTEISSPLFAGPDPAARGTCGRARKGVELRIVDEHDCELPVGDVGELVVRTEMPYGLNHGYHDNAEATAKAWRNGWFHTGDAFRRDEDGFYFFVDRIKDAIRRRGENVSSFEVEKEIVAQPTVRDAAVVAVASEFGEDEILAVISPTPGLRIDLRELVDALQHRLAHFMVPRYFRVLDELPRTPTNKVQKARLADFAVNPSNSFDLRDRKRRK